MDTISLIVLGIYTLIYVVVFFIQKSSIDNLKTSVEGQSTVINSMKSYMDMFDVEKVREFSKMTHETNLMKVDKLLMDDEKIQYIMNDTVDSQVKELVEIYTEQMGEKYSEMIDVICRIIEKIHPDERIRFINQKLGKNKDIFISIFSESDNSDS